MSNALRVSDSVGDERQIDLSVQPQPAAVRKPSPSKTKAKYLELLDKAFNTKKQVRDMRERQRANQAAHLRKQAQPGTGRSGS